MGHDDPGALSPASRDGRLRHRSIAVLGGRPTVWSYAARMARDGENAHEGENDAQSRPPSRSVWTSGWVGTPGLIAAALAVVAIFHLLEHRPTAAI